MEGEGTYPIGTNGSWHGGIHLYAEPLGWVRPFFGGRAVACKIQERFYRIPYLPRITEAEHADLSAEERAAYVGNEQGHYAAETPPEREYSTSYVALEHSITVPNVRDNNSNNDINLTFNFFTLYMHLLPYGEWAVERETFGGLPFYLRWLLRVKRVGRNVNFLSHQNNRIYNGTRYVIADSTIFHPTRALAGSDGRIDIETVVGRETAVNVTVRVPLSHINRNLSMRLRPQPTRKIPIFTADPTGFINHRRMHKLGYIRKNTPDNYRVGFNRTDERARRADNGNILITIRNDQGNIIEGSPRGIIRSAIAPMVNQTAPPNIRDTENAWMYYEQPLWEKTLRVAFTHLCRRKDKRVLQG